MARVVKQSAIKRNKEPAKYYVSVGLRDIPRLEKKSNKKFVLTITELQCVSYPNNEILVKPTKAVFREIGTNKGLKIGTRDDPLSINEIFKDFGFHFSDQTMSKISKKENIKVNAWNQGEVITSQMVKSCQNAIENFHKK
jgi:hypothetical protein